MTIREGRDRLVDDLQHGLGGCADRLAVSLADHGGQLGPDSASRGEVEVHAPPHGHPGLRGKTSLLTDRLDLRPLRRPPCRRRIREEGQVAGKELRRDPAGVRTGGLGHAHQPGVVRSRNPAGFRREVAWGSDHLQRTSVSLAACAY
jgi:hypothetical protein